MAASPFTASKSYEKSPFILTDRKLSRVVEVAKERFERINSGNKLHERYEVDFKDGKELRIDSLESLLSLDNSQKNPITYIRINLAIESDKKDEPTHEIWIHFKGGNTGRRVMGLSGISDELPWLQETMGALEEQLERTIPNDWPYAINGISLAVFVGLFVGFSTAFLSLFLVDKAGPLHLNANHIEKLTSLSSTAKSEAEKLDFVFHYLSATLEKDSVAETVKRLSKSPRSYLIGIPALVGLLSAIAAIFFFYPRHVFAWGDCLERYERTIELRKFLWYGVFLALIIGILGNLFVIGVTS